MNLDKLANDIYTYVQSYVDPSLAAIAKRLKTQDEKLAAFVVKDGADGAPGLDGKDGADGIDGKDGAPGLDGKDGKDGKDGAPGLTGKDGAPGLVSTVCVEGPAGPPGDKGTKGDPGTQGAPGEAGTKGDPGKDGRDGREGKDGTPGRDALELDILPAIDFAKSYPRGTLASNRGGLWRAIRSTEGAEGWVCIVDGLSHIEVKQDNVRNFIIRTELSSGNIVLTTFAIPALLDRTVFKVGTKYQAGDGVTHQGSFWIAQKDTASAPGSDDWRLAVKRGRDGKDGAVGKQGSPGAPGASGRDLTQMGLDGRKW